MGNMLTLKHLVPENMIHVPLISLHARQDVNVLVHMVLPPAQLVALSISEDRGICYAANSGGG
jgi:hypothetical protein